MNQPPQIYASDIVGLVAGRHFRLFTCLLRDDGGRPIDIAYYVSDDAAHLDVTTPVEALVVGLDVANFTRIGEILSSAVDEGDGSEQSHRAEVNSEVGALYFEFLDTGELMALLVYGTPLYGYFERGIVTIEGGEYRLSLYAVPSEDLAAVLTPVTQTLIEWDDYVDLTREEGRCTGTLWLQSKGAQMPVQIEVIMEGDDVRTVNLTLPDGKTIDC